MKVLTDRVDALFAEWDRPGSPGCALGVIRDGQLVYARGYGMANLDYDVPLTPGSVFYIASTSKQFTAASIVLLAQRGVLSLDDDIRKYVPEIPRYAHPITIRHLVHHTSGLRDYLTLMELAGKSHEDYFDLADAVESLARQKELNFSPGEQYLYCNSGYALMAEIVKRASGQSLREFAKEAIFPSRLAHQVADIYLAATFTVDSSTMEESPELSDGELQAFTGAYQSLTSGMIMELSVQEGRLTADAYGLTLQLAPVSGTSFRTLDAPVELEIQFERHSKDQALLARVIIEGQEPDTFQAIEIVSPIPDQLVDYVGDYFSDELQATYQLVLEDDGLHCRYRNAPRDPMKPGPRDVFRLPQATLSFARDDRDVVSGFTLSAEGARNLKFVKR